MERVLISVSCAARFSSSNRFKLTISILAIWMTVGIFLLNTDLALLADESDDQAKVESFEYPGEDFRKGVQKMVDLQVYATVSKPGSVKHRASLVEAYTMLWCFGFVPRDEILSDLKAQAEAALKLDDNDAGAQTAMGIAELSQWKWKQAEKHLQRAVELDPENAQSLHWYALFLSSQGRHDEAIQFSERAVKVDDSPGMITGMGAVLYFGRDWERMIKEMKRAIKKDPKFAPAYDWLGMAYVQQKRFPEAIKTYEKAVSLSGGLAEIVAGLGHAYALAGEEEKARETLGQLKVWQANYYVPPVQIAYVSFGLGENEEAFQLLGKAYEQHSWELVFMREEPWFDRVRDDPRFAEIMAKLNFPAKK